MLVLFSHFGYNEINIHTTRNQEETKTRFVWQSAVISPMLQS